MKFIPILLVFLSISCGQNGAYNAGSRDSGSSTLSDGREPRNSSANQLDTLRVTSSQELFLVVKCSWEGDKILVLCEPIEDEQNIVHGYQYNLDYLLYDHEGLRMRDIEIVTDSKSKKRLVKIKPARPESLSFIEVKALNPHIKIENSTIEASTL